MFSGGFSRGSSRDYSRGFYIRSEDFPETLGSVPVSERRKTWKKNKSKALEKNEENFPTLGGKKTSKPLEKERVLEKKKPEAKQCSICICDLEEEKPTTYYDIPPSSQITKLKCGHSFHKKCIETWFEEKNTCPVCRNEEFKPEISRIGIDFPSFTLDIMRERFFLEDELETSGIPFNLQLRLSLFRSSMLDDFD